MKLTYLSILTVGLALTQAHSAILYTFDDATPYETDYETNSGDTLEDVGWNVTGGTNTEYNVSTAFVSTLNGSNAGALGNGYIFSEGLVTSASNNLSSGIGLQYSYAAINLAVIDPDNAGYSSVFNVSIANDNGGNLATIEFRPVDPAGVNTEWEIYYSMFDGGLQSASENKILLGANYIFQFIIFEGHGYFGYGSADQTGPDSFFSTFGGISVEDYDLEQDFGDITLTQTHADLAAADNATNTLLFDNIAVSYIPEPSTALLGSIAALGLLRRRRA